MRKRLLHSIVICIYTLSFLVILLSCNAENNASNYLLIGSWESANIDNQFVETSSSISSRTTLIPETDLVLVAPTREIGTPLPYALIIRYNEGTERTQELTSRIENYGKEVSRVMKAGFDFSRVEINNNERTSIENIIRYYEQLPMVKYVEEDHIVSAQNIVTVNDELYYLQWNFIQLGMIEAWNIVEGNSAVIVAIIDTGIAENISDFAGTEFADGWNFVSDNNDTHDDNGHGTHVSGTVAQTTHNQQGTAGMAYGVTLMPIKVLNAIGEGYSSDIAAGIIKASDLGADIINLSLGGGEFNQTTYDALKYAYEQKGVTIFASSGNDNVATISYPAAYEEFVISVGATNRSKERAPYSSYGPKLDIVAPGGYILDDQNDGILQQTVIDGVEAFYFFDGTSMAAPHAAALGALLLSRNPQLSPAEIFTAITETAVDLGSPGKDEYYGYGLISPAAALESVLKDIQTYTISDSICVEYNDTEVPSAQWFFNAESAEIHLTLSSTNSAIAMTLYDPQGIEVESTEATTEQEIIYQIGNNRGEYSVVID